MKDYHKLSSQSVNRNETQETTEQRSRKTERRSFKIPEKVKMEFKSQKSQSIGGQHQIKYEQASLLPDDLISDGVIQRINTSICQQQIQLGNSEKPGSITFLPQMDQSNKLKSPFSMKLSREEGEKLSDAIIELLENEIKVLFTPRNSPQLSTILTQTQTTQNINVSTSQPSSSKFLNNSQIFTSTTAAASTFAPQTLSKSLYFSTEPQTTRSQPTKIFPGVLASEEEKIMEKILKQHEFLSNCNFFRFLDKRGEKRELGEIFEANEGEDKEQYMIVLKNRFKMALFVVSSFKSRICKIQHQALYFYNQEQMTDYLHKLVGTNKLEQDMQNIFDSFLFFLWHFLSTSLASSTQNATSQTFSQIQSTVLPEFASIQKQKFILIFDHFKMFLYGIKLPLPRIEYYATHKAAFDGNLPLLRRLLLQQQQRSFSQTFESDLLGGYSNVDSLGLSPLQLAVQMEARESVIICCENGQDPHFKIIPSGLSALEMAIAKKSENMMKPLFLAVQKNKHNQWERKTKKAVQAALIAAPDFSCKMRWEQESSFIFSFLKRWTPSDTYKIFKRGQQVRIDMGIASTDSVGREDESGESTNRSNSANQASTINNNLADSKKRISTQSNQQGTWSKGAWSILLKESGSLLLIDHSKLTVSNALSDVSITRVESRVDELLESKKEILPWQIKKFEIGMCKN